MKTQVRVFALATCLVAAAPLMSACQTERTAGQTVDDSAINAKVKSQLLADPQVSGLNVNVTTYRGQVQLSGYVNSNEQRQRAEQIARNVEGVKSVSNDLIVKAQ
ncbi:transporter [Sulfurifustis variabilis]|uniref:Osmotically-inducible protein Y n=1 Tax=Sulfurifustis variabilis TaxID=1675686 RepID=A0A1B4V5M5_9GAMM|nr:BON domain-containing protein [Sulfurifustis variabilis]BAU48839.1 transporter [Sulfurifustis variabilis]